MSAAPAKFAPDPRRRAMVAKVKLAQKELGIDDVAYRAMLCRITGCDSAAKCSLQQLGAVLDELQAKGWRPKPTRSSSACSRPRSADHPSAKKARALWISLYDLAVVRDPSETALEAFAGRQLGVERLQWADQGQCYKLIEALKAMAERAGWSQDLGGIKPSQHVVELKRRLLQAIDAKLGRESLRCAATALDSAIAYAARDLRERSGA